MDVNGLLDPPGGMVWLAVSHSCLRLVDHMVLLNSLIGKSGLVVMYDRFLDTTAHLQKNRVPASSDEGL